MKKLAALLIILPALCLDMSAKAQAASRHAPFGTGVSLPFPAVKSQPYNEADDPLMRRGAQNTDYPQKIFFVVPAALTIFLAAVLFYKRK